MKKLILITCLFSANLLGDGIDSTQYKFTIYPELIGLGGLPSINLEYPTNNDYIIRFGIGMVVLQAITFPVSIYKINDYGKKKTEIGIGIFNANFSQIGIAGIYNSRKESKDKKRFKRIGIVCGITTGGFVVLPTFGWGFNF